MKKEDKNTPQDSKEFIKRIITEGTAEEKRELFKFNKSTSHENVVKKFNLFSRGCYPRYFAQPKAPFHNDFIMDMVKSYYGDNSLLCGFRGCAKTSLKKLFDVFVLLNDEDGFRKYMKVLCRDIKNSKQISTDVYNLIIEVKDIYGNVFEKEGDTKREETMGSFTMANGRKYLSGTVGQTQRGHVQDAFRPDWVWFEDVEDSESIRSAVITRGVMDKCSEAITGLSFNGSYFVTCNYISDQGTIQWFMNKDIKKRIVPLLTNDKDNSSVTWDIYTSDKVAKMRKDTDDFFGEYQCDPNKSDNKFFDINRINEDLKKCREPERESVGVKYWSSYKPNHRYGMGSDHSEGIGLDSNTMVVFDFTTGEIVCDYASNEIAPDLSAHEFARVGREYGNCIYAPEVNNKCGGTVITTLKNIPYTNIYKRVDTTSYSDDKETEKLGWDTNSKTKYNMFFEFKTDYNDGLIKIYDKNILAEMKAYSNNDLNETKAGLITRHFDLLTSAVISWQMRKHAVNRQETYDYNSLMKDIL